VFVGGEPFIQKQFCTGID